MISGKTKARIFGAGLLFALLLLSTCDTVNNYYTYTTVAGAPGADKIWQVTTLAGSAGGGGYANGTGSAAQFNAPSDVAVDQTGNCYVADTVNHLVRKITPDGVVTFLSGDEANLLALTTNNGFANGSGNGLGTSAQFNYPYGLCVTKTGIVYMADGDNHLIRKITAGGNTTTFAGNDNGGAPAASGTSGSADGVGTAASFNKPLGICIDSTGTNLYVADTFNSVVRKIVISTQTVSTVAGIVGSAGFLNATGTSAQFNNPIGIAVDSANYLYVVDQGNNLIRKISPTGVVTTLAGSVGLTGMVNGTGSAAYFNSPTGICVDSSGNCYVVDQGNNMIRKITSIGVVTTFAGYLTAGSVDATGVESRFSNPYGICIDAAGKIYLADQGNQTIRVIQ